MLVPDVLLVVELVVEAVEEPEADEADEAEAMEAAEAEAVEAAEAEAVEVDFFALIESGWLFPAPGACGPSARLWLLWPASPALRLFRTGWLERAEWVLLSL